MTVLASQHQTHENAWNRRAYAGEKKIKNKQQISENSDMLNGRRWTWVVNEDRRACCQPDGLKATELCNWLRSHEKNFVCVCVFVVWRRGRWIFRGRVSHSSFSLVSSLFLFYFFLFFFSQGSCNDNNNTAVHFFFSLSCPLYIHLFFFFLKFKCTLENWMGNGWL